MTTTEKPRFRGSAQTGFRPIGDKAITVADSYQNLEARLGAGSGNAMDSAGYALTNLITRMPRNLEYMYRGSWVVGAAVDSVADDMTRAGVDFGAAIEPDVIEAMEAEAVELDLWGAIGDTERWARLYGGAIGVIMIDGQDLETPLRLEAVGQDQFRGVLALDRWSTVLTVGQVISNMGPGIGRPDYYQIGPNAPALVGAKIHHSRVIRREGIRLPFVQRQAEQGWGLSIVERMYDRLLAFDSATTGAAQLVFKAYLRTLKKKGLNQILAAGGPAMEALAKNVEQIRRFQSMEGMTMIDDADELTYQAYTFSGLDSILLQFGEQISGATEIPLVRLFGRSPAGLNSTGDGDIRNYYDSINAKQKRHLLSPVGKVLRVLHKSVTGEMPPKGFTFKFNPLWQLSDSEKATTAKTVTETVTGAYEAGLISAKTGMQELKQSADVTGVFSNITDEQIEAADDEPPEPPTEEPAAIEGEAGAPGIPDPEAEPEEGAKPEPEDAADAEA